MSNMSNMSKVEALIKVAIEEAIKPYKEKIEELEYIIQEERERHDEKDRDRDD